MIDLVLSKNNCTSFHIPLFAHTIKDYFNIVYVEDGIPNKNNSLLISNLTKDRWYMDLYQQGYPLVIDLLWGGWSFDLPNAFKLITPNWFWYHEALIYKGYQYDQYVPLRQYTKKALMPMGLQKESCDLLYGRVGDYLDDFIYSYIQRTGKYLPDDLPPMYPASSVGTGQHQRYFNPMWYDHTYYSLVTETLIDNHWPLHITEKTFKPIAFYHPFLIWGQAGVLDHLHKQGFETYNNLFDESYDIELDKFKRLDKIIINIEQFKYIEFDLLTNEKLLHNHNLFFDMNKIHTRIKQEIVDPMIEFFEKR